MANHNNGTERQGASRRWIFLIGVVVLVILLSAFLTLRPRRIRITIGAPQQQDITATITTNGKVEPTQGFEAHTPPGQFTVKKVFVKEGDHVNAGQRLVQLDDATIRQQATRALVGMRAAEANMATLNAGGTQEDVIGRSYDLSRAKSDQDAAKRNLDAVNRLHQKGAAADAEVTAAQDKYSQATALVNALQKKSTAKFSQGDRARIEAEFKDAQAAYAASQELLKATNIVAPFAGTVFSLPVHDGSFLNGGEMIVQVADLQHIQVRAFVDEPEIGKLQRGLPVKINWDAIPGRTWEGKLTSTPTTIVSRGSRMVGEIVSQVDNSDKTLLPNVNVGVTVVLAQHPGALTVPREAIREEDGKKFIFVVKDNHLEKREVKTGVANLTRIEVLEGLKANDVVALASLSPSPMSDGISVKIVEQ
jgi:HlyD family secretion protein